MKRLIVARYNEDQSWYLHVPEDWKLTVVQKDVDIENVGREPSSFLHWILTHYDELGPEDTLAFMQGNPFPHCPDFLSALGRDTEGFRPLGAFTYYSDANGLPHHGGLPVKECYEAWGLGAWPGEARFAAGGQFMCRGRDILRHKPEFYEMLLRDSMVGEKAWVLERLWPVIFG